APSGPGAGRGVRGPRGRPRARRGGGPPRPRPRPGLRGGAPQVARPRAGPPRDPRQLRVDRPRRDGPSRGPRRRRRGRAHEAHPRPVPAAPPRPPRRRHPDDPAAGLAAVELDHRPGGLGQRRLRHAVTAPPPPAAGDGGRAPSPSGARGPRREDARLIRGQGRYVSDVELPRMLHVAFVRSVHAHARIAAIDATAAAALAGVVLVVTGEDPAFARSRLRARSALPGYVETEQPVLAWPEARHAGEALAAVVAVDRYAAEDGAALVSVDAEPLPAAADLGAARGGPAVHAAAPDNVLLSR